MSKTEIDFSDEISRDVILKFTPLVKNRAALYSTDTIEYDDLYQEGMIGLISAFYSFDESLGVEFAAYAKVCVNNRVISAVRKHKTKTKNSIGSVSYDELEDSILAVDKNAKPIQYTVEVREHFESVAKNIKLLLTGLEKQVLSLYLAGESYKDIAKFLDVPVKSVNNALYRVRKKLKSY